jgi:hypothetical protein
MTLSELRFFLPFLNLPKRHYAYCEAFLSVVECKFLDDGQRKEMLEQLNDLMDLSAQLDECRAELSSTMGSKGSGEQVISEYDDLSARLAAATDPGTRQTLEQSLEIVAKRRQAYQELAPTLGRLDAQQELILQTMRSAHESIARLTLAPGRALDFDIEGLKRSVTQMGEQTSAVGKAVDEVLQLRPNLE